MDLHHLTQNWYGHLIIQSPMLLVCLVACVAILTRWKQASPGAFWALLGFGLNVLLYVFLPWIQGLVQWWFLEHYGEGHGIPMFVFAPFAWSLLHAITYILLLVAVLVHRPSSVSSRSLDRPAA